MVAQPLHTRSKVWAGDPPAPASTLSLESDDLPAQPKAMLVVPHGAGFFIADAANQAILVRPTLTLRLLRSSPAARAAFRDAVRVRRPVPQRHLWPRCPRPAHRGWGPQSDLSLPSSQLPPDVSLADVRALAVDEEGLPVALAGSPGSDSLRVIVRAAARPWECGPRSRRPSPSPTMEASPAPSAPTSGGPPAPCACAAQRQSAWPSQFSARS